jgi:hypothetical protein
MNGSASQQRANIGFSTSVFLRPSLRASVLSFCRSPVLGRWCQKRSISGMNGSYLGKIWSAICRVSSSRTVMRPWDAASVGVR